MENIMTFESFIFEASEGIKIAKMLMKIDNDAFRKIGMKSGSELYQNPKFQAEYKNMIFTGLQGKEEMIKANAQEIYDKLEDENYHALNNLLSLMGLFDLELKNYYTKAHKEQPTSHLNPLIAS